MIKYSGETIFLFFFLFLLFLCWGSFLNVLAFRFIYDYDIIKKRSFCDKCKKALKIRDLIPIVSWLFLKGKCRTCKKSISILYPAIELLTAILFIFMFLYIQPEYFIAYSLFISALIIIIRTDIETMLISRFTTLYIIPIGLLLAFYDYLPISFFQSIMGIILGYGLLWLLNKLFYKFKKIEGIGEGDLELLATVGAFTGPTGVWACIVIGSFLGTLIGLILYYKHKLTNSTQIPFGPLLAIGSLIYIFTQNFLFLII